MLIQVQVERILESGLSEIINQSINEHLGRLGLKSDSC